MADGYTIGEVLNQLKEDFEDITISKIRFLESEGLVHPDRTPSGYRKFTDDDVDRLRFILTAQRDHYLPLKVIREQLDRLDAGEDPDGPSPATGLAPEAEEGGPAGEGGLPGVGQGVPGVGQGVPGVGQGVPGVGQGVPGSSGVPAGAGSGATLLGLEDPGASGSMGVRELCDASGLEPAQVRELREFGVLGNGDGDGFDGEDVTVARAARELLRLGLEARHLRMYRQFAEREQALFEQLVTPMLRQRNPEARRQATRQLEHLAELTGTLRAALLAQSLRSHLHGPAERP